MTQRKKISDLVYVCYFQVPSFVVPFMNELDVFLSSFAFRFVFRAFFFFFNPQSESGSRAEQSAIVTTHTAPENVFAG